MKEEDLKVGEVYEFKNGERRIVSFDYGVGKYNTYVVWEYADGVKRQGRAGGRTWKPSFAMKAKIKESVDVYFKFSSQELDAIIAASARLGVSESAFVQRAVAEKIDAVLESQ